MSLDLGAKTTAVGQKVETGYDKPADFAQYKNVMPGCDSKPFDQVNKAFSVMSKKYSPQE